MENCNPDLLGPQALAFLGDAVYSLLVRERLAVSDINSAKLHGSSIKVVSAPAQAAGFKLIENMLDEHELAVYKRGRNAHTSSVPKNATTGEYHSATGLEALFGYLYLKHQNDRISQLFGVIWDGEFGNTNPEQTD